MKNVERFFFPVMIFAAIVTIWVYLRGKAGATQAIVNSPATNIPGVGQQIPGLTQVLFAPAMGGGSGGPPQATPSIAANITAARDPLSVNPGATPISYPPSYLTYNYGPQFAFSKLPLVDPMVSAAIKSGSCGCGGKCDSCKSCVSPCDQANARYPDGRGTCLGKKVSPLLVSKTLANVGTFLASASIQPYAANVPPINQPA